MPTDDPHDNLGDLELIEDSIFTKEDYQNLYAHATDPTAASILDTIATTTDPMASTIADHTTTDIDDVEPTLTELKRVALIREHRGPNTDAPTYTLTALAETIHENGPEQGMKILAAQECDIHTHYEE